MPTRQIKFLIGLTCLLLFSLTVPVLAWECDPSCEGCQSCEAGVCVDDPDLCILCQNCEDGECVDDDDLCFGCERCSFSYCIDDDSKCTGECHNGCSGGNCYLSQQELGDMYPDYEPDPILDQCSPVSIIDLSCQHAGDKCCAIQTSLYTDASGAESCLADAEGCVSAVFWNCYNKFRFDTLDFVCTCDDTHEDDPVEIGTHKVCESP